MRHVRWIAVIIVCIIGLAGLAALDLSQQGLLWNGLWSVTGEESPAAQLRGVVEWLGAHIRTPLRTEPLVPIGHVHVSPYGINTFLEQEVEVAKRDRQVQMIAEAGFGWIRQEFPWEDIEIHGRGDFEDRRNDVDGDGNIDTIDAWEKYDHIVDVVEQYGLRLQVRLSNPPSWTHANPEVGEKAPPDELQDFVNFAVQVAERYRGRIHHYQIWNEPNIFPEWGNQAVDPVAYTEMLCRTYDALKAVDPQIVVISAALAPTINLTDRDLNDLVFLQRMYDAGAGDCFDVMSTQGYGFFSGPTDQRMRPTTLTFSHHLYVRDVMVANGDAHKPIWLAEAAWNAQPEAPDIVTSQYGNFGIVTEEQAARYMPLAYERAQREWPWLGVINYWFFKRASDAERNQAFYYFRMVEPDFTPLPVYDTMRQYIRESERPLYAGVHQAEAYPIAHQDGMQTIGQTDSQMETAAETSHMAFRACGTEVIARWRNAQGVDVTVDGSMTVYPGAGGGTEWQMVSLAASGLKRCWDIELAAAADTRLMIDSVTILDRSAITSVPLAAGGLTILGLFAYAFISGLAARGKR